MSKVGFSTSKGFHDDIEGIRQDAKLIRVEYAITDLKIGNAVELDLPEGRTADDIIGIEFLGTNHWLTCFGRGRETGSVGLRTRHCVGFVSGGTSGLHVEYAYVNVTPNGEKFSFEISRIGTCYTAGGDLCEYNDTAGDYVFGDEGITRSVFIHFK